jgi:lipid-binding SYLF domain-containing protein
MKKRGGISVKILFVAVTITLVAGFALPAAAAGTVEQQGLVDKARATFSIFMNDENFPWLHENLNRSKGLLIIPSLLKGGFFLGGSGGSGVLVVRDEETGQWSQPGFYTIGSVTFGLQIGGEAAEVIMVARTRKALDALYKSSFKLGGDTSIAIGPVGIGAKSNIVADLVSFARSKGAYAGVSLEGAVVATRGKWNRAYYGREVRPVDIFVTRSVSNPGSSDLRATLARASGAGPGSPSTESARRYHEVRRGDTLYGIGRKYGVDLDELRRLNNIREDQVIYPGQQILLPPGS